MGYFVQIDKDGNEISKRIPNHFVDSGKQMVLNFMFNSTSWLTGAAWYAPRFMGAGISTNTNAGLDGPSGTTNTSVSGSWQGVSNTDYKLSSELTIVRPQINVIRSGKTISAYTRFKDTDFPDGSTTNYTLVEFGIFCSGYITSGVTAGHTRYPTADPTQSELAVQRNNCMLVRGVNYDEEDGNYKAVYLPKRAGEDLIVEYVFADFEG